MTMSGWKPTISLIHPSIHPSQTQMSANLSGCTFVLRPKAFNHVSKLYTMQESLLLWPLMDMHIWPSFASKECPQGICAISICFFWGRMLHCQGSAVFADPARIIFFAELPPTHRFAKEGLICFSRVTTSKVWASISMESNICWSDLTLKDLVCYISSPMNHLLGVCISIFKPKYAPCKQCAPQ